MYKPSNWLYGNPNATVRGQQKQNIYATQAYRHEAPVWKYPNAENTYVKILFAAQQNPGLDAKELSKVGAVDIWKTLVNYGFIVRKEVIPAKGRKYFKFFIAPPGEEILNEVNETKWAYDFLKLIQDTKSKSLEEFDVQMTLAGTHEFAEYPFLKKVKDILTSTSEAYRHIERKLVRELGTPFINEILDFVVTHSEESKA